MALTIGVPKETAAGERRVAVVPEVVQKITSQGFEIVVEAGAGEAAYFTDDAFREASARIGTGSEAFGADIVLKVRPPSESEIGKMKSGSVLLGLLDPLGMPALSLELAKRSVTGLSLELVPRISRAQKMDALSAMSGVAGYEAVLQAATALPRFFPLLTTAAGTVKPANVLVLGAGVAGLQAIATARRLGARVSAYDIRDAAQEEVHSLGAKFVELAFETQEDADTGGYATALTAEKATQQTALLAPHIAAADVVISTALVPGRPAPILVTEEALQAMKPGSVVVDLAAPGGGNCTATKPGETVTVYGVRILGPLDLPSKSPVDASTMYARTLLAVLTEFSDGETFRPDFEDEIFKGMCVTHEGQVVHERVRTLLDT
jgi:NAD(P) transhydrogenase subunit alpha